METPACALAHQSDVEYYFFGTIMFKITISEYDIYGVAVKFENSIRYRCAFWELYTILLAHYHAGWHFSWSVIK